jgi:hypothetical protein
MSLESFLAELDAKDRSLVSVNRTEPRPLQRMLEGLFESQPVTVAEHELPTADGDYVGLLEDGEIVATSSFRDLQDAILLVNSDLFVTGARDLEDVRMPDVLDGLTETPFTLRGYPDSNSEKLLLILVSRHIERLAWEGGSGSLRSSFQQLSRIEDERGTRNVYRRLSETDLDLHLYGVPDATPPPEVTATVHGGDGPEFRNSWFVVYEPRGADADAAALVALETDPRRWRGFWTYRPELVERIDEYVAQSL